MSTAAQAPRRWRAVLLALLPAAGLLLLVELVLAAFGLFDPDASLSLTRGFDERAAYLVPDPARPGGFVTQMFDGEAPEVLIPPKGERRRLLLFGGSNTEGFPTAALEEELNRLDPAPGWEVWNLGRRGYGSERVRILFEQALAAEPDVALIYVGHNEFVEAGFALELAREWSLSWPRRAAGALARLRTVQALAAALRSSEAADPGLRPESRRERDEAFRDLSYDQTLGFYDAYRANVQAMLDAAARADVRVVLSTVIANDFDPPTVATLPDSMTPADAARLRALHGKALAWLPARLVRGLVQVNEWEPVLHLKPEHWGEGLGVDARVAAPGELPSADEREAAHIPAGAAARRLAFGGADAPSLRPLLPPLDRGPFWHDPELWTGRVVTVLATYAAIVARELSAEERAALESARELFEQARVLAPDHPLNLFELGLCEYLLGHDAEAAGYLRQAASSDRAPTRGNDLVNGILRELAAGAPEIGFVDADALYRARCPSGLLGYEILMDNCHLHPAVRLVLMADLAPAVLEP